MSIPTSTTTVSTACQPQIVYVNPDGWTDWELRFWVSLGICLFQTILLTTVSTLVWAKRLQQSGLEVTAEEEDVLSIDSRIVNEDARDVSQSVVQVLNSCLLQRVTVPCYTVL